MRHSFDYVPVPKRSGTVHRPILTVGVEYQGRYENVSFIIDSGADFSLLSRDSTALLGMELFGGERLDVSGILGKADCFKRAVRMTVPGFEARPFDSKVYVSEKFKNNLLGHDNFFHHFIVAFDSEGKRFVLDDRKP